MGTALLGRERNEVRTKGILDFWDCYKLFLTGLHERSRSRVGLDPRLFYKVGVGIDSNKLQILAN